MKTKTEVTLDMNEVFNLFVSGADANITFLTDAGAMASVEECCENDTSWRPNHCPSA